MDFDEYDYLEKTVENPDFLKVANGDGGRLSDREERGYRRGSKRRGDEDSRGQDYDRKRSRAEEEERDRGDKDRGLRNSGRRSPSQHLSRDRDKERDREKVRFDRERGDREREKGDKDRDRERTEKDYRERDRASRERERDRASRERERERIRGDKEKERDREKDRGEREKSRGKSRDSDRHRDNDGDRERDKEREAHKEREKESHRDRDHEREHVRSRERKERKEEPAPAEPEADPERDQRTVFAYQISLKADERDVYEFFSRAGKVRDVRLIMDRNSRRSKGVGYIEFYDAMSVPIAIAMSGQLLLGQPVMVKPSEAEKNLVQSTTTAAGGAGGYTGPYSGGARRLYVGNLHFNITEDQLRQVFEPFGPVELVQLPTDPETGQCKGFGFVQYQKLEDARAAQQALNGVLELVGRPIKVSAVTDQYGMQDMGVTPGDLDDDEGGGLALNARSRALLMQKLDRSGTAIGAIGAVSPNPIAAPSLGMPGATVPGVIPAVAPLLPTSLIGQALPGITLGGNHNPGVAAAGVAPAPEPIGVPSDCLLLKNMFDPNTETEPDFDLDIKDDVQEECSKFGVVKHIYVEKNSAGHVYLRFDGVTAAMNAQRALHGRWFAGKMITATYMTAFAYQTKFPESR
ncbi:hypothetical protein O6H91_03G096500 [Diphasiastrum complanatum]|uniref:Uncharacterized protein n=7 Tax=Diphasiastrum complanatum TaxID=34168 RepID=A0ACC2E9E9_DIPCM|nr:hypothetical protein O6H91_03G096500 [Diphasiastrum complanatum]KAJ7563091.1 hypothetical protein O6H91_03G096500 [Diphasiastrum complanatum]KAJ7563093.1 hypothetical protein O6H91_03G096500 [Diphasiastrum complanatum]KAJ7563094.1 hypothetical protein O6H91_03G096500 [Diphasiastrum complanatum]KAJ7563099.1 hypothetical protein O6H91_03G096500 [Diphasiastrum complanatum]